MQGSEGVSCDVQIVGVLEVSKGHVYGHELRSQDDVIFLESSGIDHDRSVAGLVYDRGSQFGVGVNFGSVRVYPVLRAP